jgi:hypothetical protein
MATPGGDTYLHSQFPTTNYGSSQYLYFGESALKGLVHMLIAFVVDEPFVSKAELFVWIPSGSSEDVHYEILRLDQMWFEGLATWNTYTAVQPWPGGPGALGDCSQDGKVTGTIPEDVGGPTQKILLGDVTEIVQWSIINAAGVCRFLIRCTQPLTVMSWRSVFAKEFPGTILDPSLVTEFPVLQQRNGLMLNSRYQNAYLLEASNQRARMFTQDQPAYALEASNQRAHMLVANQLPAYMKLGV